MVDALDALLGVEHDGHRLVIERDALGREVRRTTGDRGVAIQSAYDAMDRLLEQRAVAPSPGGGVPAVLVQRQWRYDARGRVTRIDDGRWGATLYRYDRIGQLLEARRGNAQEAFDYDAGGSLRSMLHGLEAGEEQGWETAAGGLLTRTGRAKYTYDQRGRRVVKLELGQGDAGGTGRATAYRWDCRDRLREVRLPSGDRVVFAYDAFGRRVRKAVFSAEGVRRRLVEYLWDGDALAADLDPQRGARCFVHAPGTLIPLLQQERGEVLTYVNDHLGTPKELIDPAGLVAWSAAHDAWGKVREIHVDPVSELNRSRKVNAKAAAARARRAGAPRDRRETSSRSTTRPRPKAYLQSNGTTSASGSRRKRQRAAGERRTIAATSRIPSSGRKPGSSWMKIDERGRS